MVRRRIALLPVQFVGSKMSEKVLAMAREQQAEEAATESLTAGGGALKRSPAKKLASIEADDDELEVAGGDFGDDDQVVAAGASEDGSRFFESMVSFSLKSKSAKTTFNSLAACVFGWHGVCPFGK
jgi:hypothetical protein